MTNLAGPFHCRGIRLQSNGLDSLMQPNGCKVELGESAIDYVILGRYVGVFIRDGGHSESALERDEGKHKGSEEQHSEHRARMGSGEVYRPSESRSWGGIAEEPKQRQLKYLYLLASGSTRSFCQPDMNAAILVRNHRLCQKRQFCSEFKASCE